MDGQDQRRVFRNAKIIAVDDNTLLGESVDFRGQRIGVKHHAIADNAKFAGANNA